MSKARDLASGAPAPAGVSTTELGYIDGVTSAIQTQLNTKSAIADDFAAGKNKIINGDFSINQRAFTSTTTGGIYGFDRWKLETSGATATYTSQTFTLGTAPVTGYESKNFARLEVTVGNDFCRLEQPIEDVRTFAGQTITISFFAKGTNPATTGNLSVEASQVFGTGGSPSSTVRTVAGTFVLTANWTRYSLTVAVPSISGKTIGTNENSSLQISFGQAASTSTDAWTLDLWGVQVEAGSTASPFQTATGTKQGELALCQRYYYRTTPGAVSKNFGICTTNSSTLAIVTGQFPVTMRTTPTALEQTGTANQYATNIAGTITTCSSVPAYGGTTTDISYSATFTVASGLTAGQGGRGITDATNGATAYLGWSAEL